MKRPRILLVDDALSSARMLGRMLTEDGFDVDVAGDGEQALDQLRRNPPDLLITDIHMLGVDGLTVAGHARGRDPGLPVIFITAYPQLAPRPPWRGAAPAHQTVRLRRAARGRTPSVGSSAPTLCLKWQPDPGQDEKRGSMVTEPTITYRNLDPIPSITEEINERFSKIAKLSDKISHCEVVVETPHRSHNKGDHFHVRIRVTLPGVELVADRDQDGNGAHEDLHVALRDAFESLKRRMQDHQARLRAGRKAAE